MRRGDEDAGIRTGAKIPRHIVPGDLAHFLELLYQEHPHGLRKPRNAQYQATAVLVAQLAVEVLGLLIHQASIVKAPLLGCFDGINRLERICNPPSQKISPAVGAGEIWVYYMASVSMRP